MNNLKRRKKICWIPWPPLGTYGLPGDSFQGKPGHFYQVPRTIGLHRPAVSRLIHPRALAMQPIADRGSVQIRNKNSENPENKRNSMQSGPSIACTSYPSVVASSISAPPPPPSYFGHRDQSHGRIIVQPEPMNNSTGKRFSSVPRPKKRTRAV